MGNARGGSEPERTRILVVDDHELVRRVVQRQLCDSYSCAFASSAKEARESLAKEGFELVLCDIYLPDGSGLDLAEELISRFAQTAVVLMTAEDDPEVAKHAFTFGIHGYLVKPFGRGQLLVTIMNALKRHELELGQRAHAHALTEQLQTVIDRAPLPIYAKDRSLRYILANRTAEQQARRPRGGLIGLTDEAIMPQGFASRAQASDRHVLEYGAVHEEEQTLEIGGEERVYLTVKFPLFDDNGEIYAVCGVSPDITATKQADRLRDELAGAQAKAIEDLRSSRLETVQRLARALELHDANLGLHVDRMANVTAFLARAAGLAEERAELLHTAASMHDVGKIGLPGGILAKAGALTSEERTEMERHTQLGYELLADSESELLRLAATIALTHHERFDGSGYPRGLAGEEIPIEGRIAALADVFDALLSDRSYRPALALADAVALIREGRGTHFDPRLVDLLLAHLDDVLELRRT